MGAFALSRYPKVFDEHETIRLANTGRSLSRLGDGELKIAFGHGIGREPRNRKLTEEIRSIIFKPAPGLLVGIPTMDPDGIRYWNWKRHIERYANLLPADGEFYSAFVARPDCAQWIDNKEYVLGVQQLWMGKRVTVVAEANGSMIKAVEYGAREIVHVECPVREAYAVIGQLEAAVVESKPEITIMAAGATATCLANRLQRRGMHAMDLGTGGKFFQRWLVQ
jgi:glycosyltransferase GT-like protein